MQDNVSSELALPIAKLQRREDELADRAAKNPSDLQSRRELARIEVALRWVEAGVYGTCTVCSARLPTRQLEANPADIVCRTCAEATAHRRRRRSEADAPPATSSDAAEALTHRFAPAHSISHE